MDRKEFLKGVCGLGVCGCVLGLFRPAEPLRAEEAAPAKPPAKDPRLAFAQRQVAKLVGFMAADKSADACAAMIERTGRECAKAGPLQARFKGDPEGYLAAIKKAWGTDSTWDKKQGLFTVTVPEGECGCPLVDPAQTPAFWCRCSVGYQQEAFGTVLGQEVRVTLRESKLGGAKRCVFEVRYTP